MVGLESVNYVIISNTSKHAAETSKIGNESIRSLKSSVTQWPLHQASIVERDLLELEELSAGAGLRNDDGGALSSNCDSVTSLATR